MRIKFDPSEAQQAGEMDGMKLVAATCNLTFQDIGAPLLSGSLSEIIGLAAEHRIEEAQIRADAFCRIVANALHGFMTNKGETA